MKKIQFQNSIFKGIFIPMLILIALQMGLLGSRIFYGGIFEELQWNASETMVQRVNGRSQHVTLEMRERWTRIESTVETINHQTQWLIDQGEVRLEDLTIEESQYRRILELAGEKLIPLMRRNALAGAYIILDTTGNGQDCFTGNNPGLYLWDDDPLSRASVTNSDLQLDISPEAMDEQLGVQMSPYWQPVLNGAEQRESVLVKPYEAAISYRQLELKDLGYWSYGQQFQRRDLQVVSYTVPMLLADGTVYGVLGVEMNAKYLSHLLPYSELDKGNHGAYLLAMEKQDSPLQTVFMNGTQFVEGEHWSFEPASRDKRLSRLLNGKAEQEIYGAFAEVSLYHKNTPYGDEHWYLVGMLPENHLFAFSANIKAAMVITLLMNLVLTMLGALLISFQVVRPIHLMTNKLKTVNRIKPVILPRTDIREIDLLGEAVEQLSVELFDTSSKFARMLEMASVRIGGFEVDLGKNKLFITDNFMEIFGYEKLDSRKLTIQRFDEVLKAMIAPYMTEKKAEVAGNQRYVYCMPGEQGAEIWVQLTLFHEENLWIGLAEDITQAREEMAKIAYDRDHDVLTNLANRRFFEYKMQELFTTQKETLGVAALVMIDLDNLKYINDTYGHDYGDQYICQAADSLRAVVPDHQSIVTRVSGDEFYIFFYGFQTQEEILLLLQDLQLSIYQQQMALPDGKSCRIRASGGVAWYPQDSEDYEMLRKYADFTMYKIKKSQKGEFGTFDLGSYQQEVYLLDNKEELNRLLEEELVAYHFQPIVDVRTGQPYAYEALMRSQLASFKSPLEINNLAKLEFKLDKMERLTWFKAMEAFVDHLEQGRVAPDCHVFINSIPNQILSEEDSKLFADMYQPYLSLIVQEIIEEEKIHDDIRQRKAQRMTQWQGEIALDDYGSGYNSERLLLRLAPKFVKIDLDIIRDIHLDPDKQKIVANLLSYTKERDICVIAEGIENYMEMDMVIRMGVDYLQGYYLGKPALLPPNVSAERQQEVVDLYHKYWQT